MSDDGRLPLHFHSLKGRLAHGMSEVADFHAPGFTAVDAIVLYFQSTVIFPSWTSRVLAPTCWDRRPRLVDYCCEIPFAPASNQDPPAEHSARRLSADSSCITAYPGS